MSDRKWLTILAGEGELYLLGILKNVNLKLSVDIREVDKKQRIGIGISDESLQDPINDNYKCLVVQSLLQLLGLSPVLRELCKGGGQAGEDWEEDPGPVHCWQILMRNVVMCCCCCCLAQDHVGVGGPPDLGHCWTQTDSLHGTRDTTGSNTWTLHRGPRPPWCVSTGSYHGITRSLHSQAERGDIIEILPVSLFWLSIFDERQIMYKQFFLRNVSSLIPVRHRWKFADLVAAHIVVEMLGLIEMRVPVPKVVSI